ncbi:uncharacterized protein LOC116469907 [Hylobates moloch]|uniref:uncharacterized protein LOC116469907 n=1 Tax=Hylobates moloch TaxID=81572 RepID=UPI00267702D0|nr:uncharacterized protein LOC116469907 [Hylobates moloch]
MRRRIPVPHGIETLAFSRLRHDRLLFENGTRGRALWPPLASVVFEAGGANLRAGRSAAAGSSRSRASPGRSGSGARCPAAGPPERQKWLPACAPACTRTRSVTPGSWLLGLLLLLSQQRGGRERLLGVSSPARPACCRLLAAKEESLCLCVRSLRFGHGSGPCACSQVLSAFWGCGCCPGSAQKGKGFPNFPSYIHRPSSYFKSSEIDSLYGVR